MKLKDWFKADKNKNKRLSDSTVLSGLSIGDSEKKEFISVWANPEVLSSWSKKRIKRL